MNQANLIWLLAALPVGLLFSPPEAAADSCVWSGKAVGQSTDKRYVVTAEYDDAKKQ